MNIWVVEALSKKGLKVTYFASTKRLAVQWVKRRGRTKRAFLITRKDVV